VLTGVLSKRAAIAKYCVGSLTLKRILGRDELPGAGRRSVVRTLLAGDPAHPRGRWQGLWTPVEKCSAGGPKSAALGTGWIYSGV